MLKQYFSNYIECGADEAGRGCLAGPVTAAAVILPKDFKNCMLNDSKVLSLKKRKTLRDIIIKKALDYSISYVSVKIIDEINILNASLLAMNLAIDKLQIKPEFIIVDGNRFESKKEIPYRCIIKGDSKYMSIAAASILAKVYRDEIMLKYSKQFPEYGFQTNSGYGTKEHLSALKNYGITPIHRKSFKPVHNILN